MKVFLDDERETPPGWVRVCWPEEAIELLKTNRVIEISLDHDLGDDQRGTGYDVILWIEEAVMTQSFVPPKIIVHSSNASARQKMELGIESIRNHSQYLQAKLDPPPHTGSIMDQATETEPTTATLEQLSLARMFEKNLRIPEYQRSYAWAAAHVTDLVTDLAKRDGSYLLGTVVLHQQGEEFYIVDGQQRLVTLTILMSELLSCDVSACNLPLLNQKFSESSKGAIKEAQQTIRNALSALGDQEKKQLNTTLRKLEDGILFTVVIVAGESIDLAFDFFDSVNSKGLRLSDFDLLKAHHLMYIPVDQEALAIRHNGAWQQRNDEQHSLVFGAILRRIRMWSRNESRDSWHERPDYDEFQALVDPDAASGAEHRFSRYMQPAAFRSWRRENGRVVLSMDWPIDQSESLLPFEMTQTIEGGDSFFLFAMRYHELYDSLFGPDYTGRSTASAFVHQLARHISNVHIKTAFCSLMMLYVDKFSDDRLIEAGVYLETIVSEWRWKKDRVRIEGTLDHVRNSRLVPILVDSVNARHACSQLERIAKIVTKPTKTKLIGVKSGYFDGLAVFYTRDLGRIPGGSAHAIARHYQQPSA